MLPVFEPDFGEEEIAAVVRALRRGEISGSFGRDITDFEEAFAAACGCRYGIASTSGTIESASILCLSCMVAVLLPAGCVRSRPGAIVAISGRVP